MFCSRKRPVESPKEKKKWGQSEGAGLGKRRENVFSPLPLPFPPFTLEPTLTVTIFTFPNLFSSWNQRWRSQRRRVIRPDRSHLGRVNVSYIEDITWPLGVTKFLFECWKNIFQHSKRNFVSPSGHVMFYSSYKHQRNTKPFHFNSFLVWRSQFIM